MQEEMNSLHKNKTYELVVTKEKLKLCVRTASMNSNWRVRMKISFLNRLEGEIVGRCTAP